MKAYFSKDIPYSLKFSGPLNFRAPMGSAQSYSYAPKKHRLSIISVSIMENF